MTSQQAQNPTAADPEIPDTEVIAVSAPAPVFVDTTGRRSRVLRRLAYGFGVVVMLYSGLIAVSLAGGPVRSSAVLPLPGLDLDPKESRPPARPSPAPSPAPSLKSLFVTDALPRRTGARPASTSRVESTTVAKKPTAKPKPKPTKKPAPSATTVHPVESATTPAPSASAPTPKGGGTTSAPVPLPPSPPAGQTGTGGQGGGSTMPASDAGGPASGSSGGSGATSESSGGSGSGSSSAGAADATKSAGRPTTGSTGTPGPTESAPPSGAGS